MHYAIKKYTYVILSHVSLQQSKKANIGKKEKKGRFCTNYIIKIFYTSREDYYPSQTYIKIFQFYYKQHITEGKYIKAITALVSLRIKCTIKIGLVEPDQINNTKICSLVLEIVALLPLFIAT